MSLLDGIRSGSLVDRERVRTYGRLIAGLNVLSLVALLATSQGGRDRFRHLVGSDFLSFWAAGKLLLARALPYDEASHLAEMQGFAPDLAGYPAFYYPPSFLVLCALIGLAPYFVALAIWLCATGAGYLAAVRQWAGETDLGNPLWVWLAAFPPVLVTITHGQTSFLVAAALGGGLLLVGKRPVLAGVLLGLATIKPQFGLLVPIALLLTGSWRAICMAVASALILAALNTLTFGVDAWREWLALSGAAQTAMASGAIGFGKMVSVFAGLKVLGAPTALAYAVQGAVTALVALALAVACWRKPWSPQIAALVLAGAPLATPFVLDYDMVLLAFPLLYLAAKGYRDWEKSVSVLAFIAPIFARPLALFAGVPIMPVVLGLLFWVLWRRREENA